MPYLPEPRWQRVAAAVYAACLWLYPPAFRREFGPSMQQAFRDRCRDVQAGRLSAWRLFVHDAVLDTAVAAGGAHLDLGVGPPRARHAVLVLALLGTGALVVMQDTVVFPVIAEIERTRKMVPYLVREMDRRRDETRLRSLAEALIGTSNDDDRALGAWLLAAYPAIRVRYAQQGRRRDWIERVFVSGRFYDALPAQGRHAGEVALSIGSGASRRALAAAAAACHAQFGCMDGELLRRLALADSGNAHASFRQFRDASRAGNEARMSEALARAAAAIRHDDYQGQFRRRALRAAIALRPGDDEFLMSVGRPLNELNDSDGRDWNDDIRSNCFPEGGVYRPEGTFLERHPERVEDCMAVARLVSASANPTTRQYGRRIAVALGRMSQEESERLDREWRDQREHVGWSRVQYRSEDPPGIRWTATEWGAWARREAAAADG